MLHTFEKKIIRSDMLSVTSTVIGPCHIWGKLLPYAPFKKTTGFSMGPFKKGVVFHLGLVVILAKWFHHQGALEAFTLTHGIKACCGGDQVLQRCLDTMRTQIRAHLCRAPPPHRNVQAIEAYPPSLLLSFPLAPAFHAACSSKRELIKGPFLNDFLFRAIISQ